MSFNSLFNRTSFKEFDRIPIIKIAGKIPKEINGSLYRNTSICLERQGKRLNHWFDGDGAILKIKFQNSEVQSSYKFVQTKAFKEEESQQKFIYPNIGNMAHSQIDRWRYPNFPVNRSNTGVLPVENKLLSLWEGGKPYSLDLNTLDTMGEDDLGYLKGTMSYTAHPKVDPENGKIYNIGQRKGPGNYMDIYESDKFGQIQKTKKIKFSREPNFIHDFCLAGDYLIFFTFPITIDILNVLLRKKTILEGLEFNEQSYNEIVIIEKNSLERVGSIKTDPFFFFHYANGFQINNQQNNQKGNLIFDLCEHQGFEIFKGYTSDVLKKDLSTEKKRDKAYLSRFEIDLDEMKIVKKEKLLEAFNEFPIIKSCDVGKKHEICYLNVGDEEDFYMRNVAKMDLKKDQLIKRKFEGNVYPGEIIHIPNNSNKNSNGDVNKEGWIISVAYDADRDKSVVHLMDGESLEDVAVFDLPETTSHSFHGYWKDEIKF